MHVRAVDVRDQLSDHDPVTAGDQPRIATGVTVTPPSNNPPVASFTYSCNQNVCTFDGRGSTDENAELADVLVELRDARGRRPARCPRRPSPPRAPSR